MIPSKKEIDYEKVPTEDFVVAVIQDIEYEKDHKWKPFQGKERKPTDACRFKFAIEGCKYAHQSRWMTFSYGTKTTLYLKYLVPLVEGAVPDMRFDLDQLKGMKIKMLWVNDKDPNYQSIETIRPVGKKVLPMAVEDGAEHVGEEEPEETVPF